MRHVFIVNPAAGKHQAACARVPNIRKFFEDNPDFGTPEIVYTERSGHATEIARAYAQAGEPVRLYACGGDGTLSEVLRGMYDFDNAELACLSCGSANDYARNFPDRDFRNIAALVSGQAQPMDVIRCGDAVSLSICCMGMDADVANKMSKYKHLPLVSGPAAYTLAIADVFCHRIGKELTVTMHTPHGEVTRSGRYFFALAASGQYYGGGYHGAPMAKTDDGRLDFVLIKAMSRLKVLSFLPKYKKGEFLELPECEVFGGSSMRVRCEEGATVAIDGECFTDTDITFAISDRPVKFVLPSRGVIKQPLYSDKPNGGKRKPAPACASRK